MFFSYWINIKGILKRQEFQNEVTAGLYSSYILTVNTFEQLLGQMLDAVVQLLGNLLLENNKQKNYIIKNQALN